MSRQTMIYIIFIGYAIGIINLILFVFGDTYDQGVLSIFSLIGGLLTATIIYFIFDFMHFVIAIFLGVTLSTSIIAVTNHKLASDEVSKIEYSITGIGRNQIRYNSIEYIELTFEGMSTNYTVPKSDSTKYKVGDTLLLETRSGYWGYPIIGKLNE